jgi:hypothetical protein
LSNRSRDEKMGKNPGSQALQRERAGVAAHRWEKERKADGSSVPPLAPPSLPSFPIPDAASVIIRPPILMIQFSPGGYKHPKQTCGRHPGNPPAFRVLQCGDETRQEERKGGGWVRGKRGARPMTSC